MLQHTWKNIMDQSSHYMANVFLDVIKYFSTTCMYIRLQYVKMKSIAVMDWPAKYNLKCEGESFPNYIPRWTSIS